MGKLKVGATTLACIDGHWDQEIHIKEKDVGVRKFTPMLIYIRCNFSVHVLSDGL